MSILDQMESLEGSQEPRVVEANSEVKLRILDVRTGNDKNGNPYIMPRFEVPSDPLAKDFTKYLPVPNADLKREDLKKFERSRWDMTEFMAAFEIDVTRPGDPEDWSGKEGWAILGVSKSDEYGEQNFVKKFVKGR